VLPELLIIGYVFAIILLELRSEEVHEIIACLFSSFSIGADMDNAALSTYGAAMSGRDSRSLIRTRAAAIPQSSAGS
jgi:hypothetical protein